MRRALGTLALLLFATLAAEARIGGGDSYSGSSDSSSSSSSDSSSDSGSSSWSSGDSGSSGGSSSGGSGDGSFGFTGCAMVLFLGVFMLAGSAVARPQPSSQVLTVSDRAEPTDMNGLRKFDPNFSEIVFTDFCGSLFARVHDALGRGRLDDYAPYVSEAVRDGFKAHAAPGLSRISEVVVGAFTVAGLKFDYGRKYIEAEVEFEANYTEVASGGTKRWYVRERWTLERARDILSPAPEQAKAEHCPRCGAALETRTDGTCLHCGTRITDGSFQWFVRSVRSLEKEERPPTLGGGSGGVEPGLDRPTVYQPWFARNAKAFLDTHRDFTWEAFDARVRHVAQELQAAWSERDWHRARAYETDALFQTHRYWIDEYLRQDTRNIVEAPIDKTDVVRIASDAFYDAITVRIFWTGIDYTVDGQGNLIGGSSQRKRSWSEYWTFVRGRAAGPADARVCPNCGGSRAEGQTAICDYCGAKITTGEFPWVLSRIEQDEAYKG